jgi:hypothetical protein
VIHAAEFPPHADRPGHGRAANREHTLDLVEQLEWLAAIAVQLVDEADDRRSAEPAHFHQLDGPLLHAFGRVEDHQR